MCSGSEAGSYLRLIDFVYHSTLGLRIIKKKRSYKGAPLFLALYLPVYLSPVLSVPGKPTRKSKGADTAGCLFTNLT